MSASWPMISWAPDADSREGAGRREHGCLRSRRKGSQRGTTPRRGVRLTPRFEGCGPAFEGVERNFCRLHYRPDRDASPDSCRSISWRKLSGVRKKRLSTSAVPSATNSTIPCPKTCLARSCGTLFEGCDQRRGGYWGLSVRSGGAVSPTGDRQSCADHRRRPICARQRRGQMGSRRRRSEACRRRPQERLPRASRGNARAQNRGLNTDARSISSMNVAFQRILLPIAEHRRHSWRVARPRAARRLR